MEAWGPSFHVLHSRNVPGCKTMSGYSHPAQGAPSVDTRLKGPPGL